MNEKVADAYRILFVDDEPHTRKYFSRAFSRHFEVMTADSVKAGREILEEHGDRVAVLVVDQRMPQHVGMELLEEARRTWPRIIRFLTTAYADLDVAIQAVNDGHIFRYLLKPWDIAELRVQLKQAMEFYLLRRERDELLREKLEVLRRDLIADRMKSLAIMAGGLADHLRQSLMATHTFLQTIPEGVLGASGDELHGAARQDVKELLIKARNMVDATLLPSTVFADSVTLSEVLPPVIARAESTVGGGWVSAELDPQLPNLRVDRHMVERLLLVVLEQALVLSEDSPVLLRAQPRNVAEAPGVCIQILPSGDSTASSNLSDFASVSGVFDEGGQLNMKMLTAYFAAHHHGGDVRICAGAGATSGFEVLLPCDPAQARRPLIDERTVERVLLELGS